jgi:hypothetical protein
VDVSGHAAIRREAYEETRRHVEKVLRFRDAYRRRSR